MTVTIYDVARGPSIYGNRFTVVNGNQNVKPETRKS